ncbi:MAG: hypothetical protein K0R39_2008 [Symbiobacteriaceae bacterium]|jgi:uncharacterized protein YdhG (YjbR/CyaY superfamily)|nr:hypothetical protein [Symbiobacteriaceae bacterium]
MENRWSTAPTVDAYIAEFPPDIQQVLQELRALIRATAPEATETISYSMPTFDLDKKHLVHFAAFKQHIGLYPTPSGIEAFQEELAPYKTSKGAVQFPLGQPLPIDLIRRIVAYRVAESAARKAAKSAARGPKSPAGAPDDDFPPGIGQPARRALTAAGYTRLEQLTGVRERDLLALHGFGPKALRILREALTARGLAFLP